MDISQALAGVASTRRGSRLRDRAGWALLLLIVASGSPAASDIEQRIQQIQNGILPPALVKGESVSSNKLSDRMAELLWPCST